MSSLRTHLRYEYLVWRASRPLHLCLFGTLVIAFAVDVVMVLSSKHYLELGGRDYWTLVSTQGGAVGWPPLFAYVLAVLGTLAWAPDATGESAYLAYATFEGRAGLAATRSAAITLVASLTSVAVCLLALGTGALLDPQPAFDANLQLILIKVAWTIFCGVGFAHLGAGLCVLTRSTTSGLALLLVIPWLVEPVLIQLVDLVPALQSAAGLSAYLPFNAVSSTLGQVGTAGFTVGRSTQLEPRAAAGVTTGITVIMITVTQYRYLRSDGQRAD